MKLILLLLGALAPYTTWANALASIYNGEQVQLNGWTLVQDANARSEFYVMPRNFRVARRSAVDPATGQLQSVPDASHSVRKIDGKLYSVYSLRLILDAPSRHAMTMAGAHLQNIAGPGARIRGMAPICGIDVGAISNEATNARSAESDAVYVRYAIRSTEDGRCTSLIDTSAFNVTITAPLSMEPQLAQDLTSSTGLLTPNLGLILPYKYKERVVVRVNAKSVYQQLKQSSGLSGTYKSVVGSVSENLTKAFSLLEVRGQLHIDSENPDPTIRNAFLDQAKDILARTLVRYTAVPTKGADVTPLVVGTTNASSPSSVRVDLALDEASANAQDEFVIDFSNATYSSVRTQVQVNLANLPVGILAPQVREMLGTKP